MMAMKREREQDIKRIVLTCPVVTLSTTHVPSNNWPFPCRPCRLSSSSFSSFRPTGEIILNANRESP